MPIAAATEINVSILGPSGTGNAEVMGRIGGSSGGGVDGGRHKSQALHLQRGQFSAGSFGHHSRQASYDKSCGNSLEQAVVCSTVLLLPAVRKIAVTVMKIHVGSLRMIALQLRRANRAVMEKAANQDHAPSLARVPQGRAEITTVFRAGRVKIF